MSKKIKNHRCDFKPFGEQACEQLATWVALDGNEVMAVACDHHSDVLAGDTQAGMDECSWFKKIETRSERDINEILSLLKIPLS